MDKPAADDLREPSDGLLLALGREAPLRTFRAGTILIQEGDVSESIYLVETGRLTVFATSDGGRDIVLNDVGPGQCVGELALDGKPRSASVRADVVTACRVLTVTQLRERVKADPEVAWRFIVALSGRLRRITGQAKSLALDDVYGRINVLFSTHSSLDADGTRVLDHKLTQQDIADRVGASREMVNRILRELETGGWIEHRQGRYVVLRRLPKGR